MTLSSSKSKTMRKGNVLAGDLFLIQQSNAMFTLGQVLAPWPSSAAIIAIALFAGEVEEELGDAQKFEALANECSKPIELAAIVSTGAGVIKAGQWKKVGHSLVTLPSNLLPERPFRSGSIVGAEILSAPLVEGFIEAYRGLSDWNSLLPGRPGYLKSLLFNPGWTTCLPG